MMLKCTILTPEGYSSVSFYSLGLSIIVDRILYIQNPRKLHLVLQKTVLSSGIILICSSRVRTSSSDSNKVAFEFSPFKLKQISQFFNKNFNESLLVTSEINPPQ